MVRKLVMYFHTRKILSNPDFFSLIISNIWKQCNKCTPTLVRVDYLESEDGENTESSC